MVSLKHALAHDLPQGSKTRKDAIRTPRPGILEKFGWKFIRRRIREQAAHAGIW